MAPLAPPAPLAPYPHFIPTYERYVLKAVSKPSLIRTADDRKCPIGIFPLHN